MRPCRCDSLIVLPPFTDPCVVSSQYAAYFRDFSDLLLLNWHIGHTFERLCACRWTTFHSMWMVQNTSPLPKNDFKLSSFILYLGFALPFTHLCVPCCNCCANPVAVGGCLHIPARLGILDLCRFEIFFCLILFLPVIVFINRLDTIAFFSW